MTPIVLLLVLSVLYLSYRITYDNNLDVYEKQLRNTARETVMFCENYNLYIDREAKICEEMLISMCETRDITYIFAVEPDIENNSETYLAIGFGEGASIKAQETRYRGVKVVGYLNEQEIEAYNGNTEGVLLHEVNQFDDSLICYMPCTRYFDLNKMKSVDYQKPVVIGVEISLSSVVEHIQKQFTLIAALNIALSMLIVITLAVIMYFKVTKPVRMISERMSSFITDREKGVEKLEVKGGNEFAQMSLAFNTMTDEINRYIHDIDTLTREKHIREAEMNIARRIQMGLLQPERLETDAFDIGAYMLPAKDVGGDLYDYRLIDNDRVFVAIADVSGKGISAALFMARAITLLHQQAVAGCSPAMILKDYNNTLVTSNPGGLFITTFIAIYDPSTGRLTYSNAGHNIPYILSDTLIPLDGAHGVAAGLFEGEEYEDASILLKSGDLLFLYTDGVNEAKNAQAEFYSMERLENQLAGCSRTDTSDARNIVLKDLKDFTRGAEQNDDITMLTLYIKPQSGENILHLTSELPQLLRIKEAIFRLEVSEDLKKSLLLAAEEIFVNICSYAYDTPGEVKLKLSADDAGVEMTFIDGGKPFDPTNDMLDIDDYDHENTIGGLGRFLAFSIAERYHYEYRDGENILYLFFSEVKTDDDHEKA